MKKQYTKADLEVIELSVKGNMLIAMSASSQSNDNALGRGFDFEDDED